MSRTLSSAARSGRPRPTFVPTLETLEGRVLPANLAAGFVETTLATGLDNPTTMEFAPDGRLFVAEQAGTLRVIKDGALLPTPFVSLNVNSQGERGLLGIAFDPNFATNHFVYLYYTATTPVVHNRVSRFTAAGDVAVPGSEVPILDLNPLGATNHNGGAIHFGPDGKLYVAAGENAVPSNSQTLANLLGKVLRINSDGTVPPDNPFVGTATGINQAIWALGLRNPFSFAFQPGTGRLFIDDVGAATTEEINNGVAGGNYGWPTTEGPTTDPRFISPVYSYGHGDGDVVGCAITSGTFYNPPLQQFPAAFAGSYFFSDLCGGWINVFDPDTGTASVFATGLSVPVGLAVGPDGSLYDLQRGDGSVGRIQFPAGLAPAITQQPADRLVSVGQSVTFTVAATGEPPLAFQWQRDGVTIPGATDTSFAIPSAGLADDGAAFRVVVSNARGSATSNPATLHVTTEPVPPAGAFVTGADAGGGPNVLVFDAATGQVKFNFFAYDPAFTGGVRVAAGDVTGDGTPDVVTVPGPGGGPDVHVYDGQTGQLVKQFFAFAPSFTGGAYVAAGDVTGDGRADIVIGADAGGGPNVLVVNGQNVTPLDNFFPYDPRFTGGVRVALGDVNGDGRADVITGAGPGGGPNVSVISGADGKTLLASFFPYDPRFTAGLYVAAGDVNGDHRADVITGAGAGGGPNVSAFNGADFTLLGSFFPYDPRFTGGVRVAAAGRSGDGKADVVAAPGPGGGPDVKSFNALSGQLVDAFFAYNPLFSAGLFVGGSG